MATFTCRVSFTTIDTSLSITITSPTGNSVNYTFNPARDYKGLSTEQKDLITTITRGGTIGAVRVMSLTGAQMKLFKEMAGGDEVVVSTSRNKQVERPEDCRVVKEEATQGGEAPRRVRYTSNQGRVGIYTVVEEYTDTIMYGARRGQNVKCLMIKPTAWVGEPFGVLACRCEEV